MGLLSLISAANTAAKKYASSANKTTSNKTSSNVPSGKTSSGGKNTSPGTGVIADYLSDPAKYNNTFNVGASGNAPAGLSAGTVVNTAGGQYRIVAQGTPGATFNSSSGYWSVPNSQPS